MTRLPAALLGQSERPHASPSEWSGTDLLLPRELGGGGRGWRDALTGTVLDAPRGGRLPLGHVLARLPVALLEVAGE